MRRRSASATPLVYLSRTARSQRREIERLAQRAPGVPILQIPLYAHEASSLASLRAIGDRLGGPSGTPTTLVSDAIS